jgi:hypothetical protein
MVRKMKGARPGGGERRLLRRMLVRAVALGVLWLVVLPAAQALTQDYDSFKETPKKRS